jgi:hypothetical protein
VRRAARMVSDHALDPATIISKCRQSFEVFDPGAAATFARRNDSGQTQGRAWLSDTGGTRFSTSASSV